MRWLSYCVDGGALSLFDGPRFERPAHNREPMSSTVFFDFCYIAEYSIRADTREGTFRALRATVKEISKITPLLKARNVRSWY
jgi:hypothetical protein